MSAANQTITSASSTSPQPKPAKIRVPASDNDDASSVGSNDALSAAKVHIKSGLSSPRSSISSSGAVRRGAWRAMGAASSTSASRSFTHAYRGEKYASSSSSEQGADETLAAGVSTPAPGTIISSAQSPPHPGSSTSADSIADDDDDYDNSYQDHAQGLNMADHPAWHKLRTQPGVAPPGTLSYLPSVSPNATAQATPTDEPTAEPARPKEPSTQWQGPDSSRPDPDGTSAWSEDHRFPDSSVGGSSATRNGSGGKAIPADDGTALQQMEAGAYDWANFVYAYARGRWNPGLIPQPPGQSTAFPGAKVRIRTTLEPSVADTASTAGALAHRRPSLEYNMPDVEPDASSSAVAIAPEFEPHSLPLSARGSADAHTEAGDSTTAASLPLKAESVAPTSDAYEDKTPLRSHAIDYVSSPKKDALQLPSDKSNVPRPDCTRQDTAAGPEIDANILTAMSQDFVVTKVAVDLVN